MVSRHMYLRDRVVPQDAGRKTYGGMSRQLMKQYLALGEP
jgi:hypothetical protein